MTSIVRRTLVALALIAAACPAMAAGTVPEIAISGPIGPPMASYVKRGLRQAAKDRVPLVLIRLDTPGGLSDSMRSIIKDILASPVPVACWVGPGGARAASAGTYILYACGYASMAPGTNVGAATPVALNPSGGSDTPAKPKTAEGKKILNDAVAYITSLAQLHGRNADWAAKAVRDGASITARDALARHVIENVSPNPAALLAALNGAEIPASQGEVKLDTQGVTLKPQEQDWREQFLTVITNPTVAYLLFIIGLFGLMMEGLHPGFILPGTVGAISLILALFAFHALPVNYAGLALIVLGVILFVTEAFVTSYGTLGIGGIVAFVFGSIMLIDTHAPGYTLPRIYIGSIAAAASVVILGLLYFVVRMRRRPVVSGLEHMIGHAAVAMADFDAKGPVRIEGERWSAITRVPVRKGERVIVDSIDGLVLSVSPQIDSKPTGSN
ncbi:MAG: nodulation protein NfeD [Gammaproteobacteria bacterium]